MNHLSFRISEQPTRMSFSEKINSLLNGDKYLSENQQLQLEQENYDGVQHLGGVSLGMTIDEVVSIWGNPKGIMFFPSRFSNEMQLYIANSHFEFFNNQLMEITIHCDDLPNLRVADVPIFDISLDQLETAFVGKTIKQKNPMSYFSWNMMPEIIMAESSSLLLHDNRNENRFIAATLKGQIY